MDLRDQAPHPSSQKMKGLTTDTFVTYKQNREENPVLRFMYAPQTGFSMHGPLHRTSSGQAEDGKCQNQVICKDVKSPAPERATAPCDRRQEHNFL